MDSNRRIVDEFINTTEVPAKQLPDQKDQLVLAVSDEINRIVPCPFFLVGDNGDIHRLDNDGLLLCHAADIFIRVQPYGTFDFALSDLCRQVEKFTKTHGTEIAQRILLNRISLYALLNSFGGNRLGRLEGSMDFANRRGRTTAFVINEASSAAAELFQSAGRRYAHKKSFLLWHVGESKLSEQIEKYRIKTRDFFRKNARGPHRDACLHRVEKSLATKHHPEKEITFTGEELETYGIVEKAFNSRVALAHKFSKITGLSPTKMPKEIFFLFLTSPI